MKKKMSKKEALRLLKKCQQCSDFEVAHVDADDILLKFINDTDIAEAFEEVEKWYA